ncbi:transcription factor bHLH153-like isoform X1 [Olea europaea var. sylvestris]|uniref:transcription factor bHLH153-like isoform X1 n=1 Tax=Olea europaea var. sylvestris TaxID=158386 RepID=UPI000C1D3CCB|nr:transcription factor bHLH153-like isoform X1 [Olea europaea var. sylvestris]
MMEHKRNSVSLDQSSLMGLKKKIQKIDAPLSSKEKKEKVGERISALQQLVSPYGKTDTASVLLEAMEYIRFLHEQVKVLSAPYLSSTPTTNTQFESSACVYHFKEVEQHNLKSKGLCLVPISFTDGVASSNGADIWAPIKSSSPNSRRSISDDVSVITYS